MIILKKNITVLNMTRVSLATALITIFSQLSIPMPFGVPMTLQTFIIPLIGILLGSRLGVLSTFIYILLGMIGLPVFSGFSGGIASLIGPTGGFIVSFPVLAFCAGLKSARGSTIKLYACLTVGMLFNFFVGWLWFYLSTGSSAMMSFHVTVLPFIPTTIIKMILTVWLSKKMSRLMMSQFVR